MRRALLVAHEDVLDLVLLEQLVVDVQDRAAGIAEDVLDAFFLQAADDDFRTGELHGSMPYANGWNPPAPSPRVESDYFQTSRAGAIQG